MKEVKKVEFKIHEIVPSQLLKIIVRPYIFMIFLCLIESGILLKVGQVKEVISFWIIMMIGVFGSFFLHEYAHLHIMKKCGIDIVKIKCKMWKISLVPKGTLKGMQLIYIGVAGSFVCGAVGIVCLLIGKLTDLDVIKVIGIIYVIHLFNIFPWFGDGKMIVKGWLTRDLEL